MKSFYRIFFIGMVVFCSAIASASSSLSPQDFPEGAPVDNAWLGRCTEKVQQFQAAKPAGVLVSVAQLRNSDIEDELWAGVPPENIVARIILLSLERQAAKVQKSVNIDEWILHRFDSCRAGANSIIIMIYIKYEKGGTKEKVLFHTFSSSVATVP